MENIKIQKYYAIKLGKGVKNKIVYTWDECKELIYGYPSVYKSFKTLEEAEKYLDEIEEEKVSELSEIVRKCIENSKNKKQMFKYIDFKIPLEVYDKFFRKINEESYDKNRVLSEMISEWVD